MKVLVHQNRPILSHKHSDKRGLDSRKGWRDYLPPPLSAGSENVTVGASGKARHEVSFHFGAASPTQTASDFQPNVSTDVLLVPPQRYRSSENRTGPTWERNPLA